MTPAKSTSIGGSVARRSTWRELVRSVVSGKSVFASHRLELLAETPPGLRHRIAKGKV
jgi:hypothetical protein